MKKSELIPYSPKRPPGWKCPKKFKLGLELPRESSDSEDNSNDELFRLASQRYEEQARRTLMEEEANKCDEDELLLMASQQYEEQAGKNQMEKKAKESVLMTIRLWLLIVGLEAPNLLPKLKKQENLASQ